MSHVEKDAELIARIRTEQRLAQQARETAATHERAAATLIDEAFRRAFTHWTESTSADQEV